MDETIIQVKNLSKKYGNFIAVDNISFEVKKSEIFGFLGPNGAGKSTTISILTTLLGLTNGSALVNKFDVCRQKDQVRHSFGIVFQDPSLDNDLTALENLQFHATLYNVPKKLAKERIEYLLKFVELWGRKDDLVKNYSGGMKRRLEIARGLIHHPKILFLDEPTLGLDAQTRNHLWEFIKKLNKEEGMTVFFTTHYLEEAEKVADRISIIDHGKIVIQGTSQSIKKITKTKSLEEAFLKLTGKTIREETAGVKDIMRMNRKVWGR